MLLQEENRRWRRGLREKHPQLTLELSRAPRQLWQEDTGRQMCPLPCCQHSQQPLASWSPFSQDVDGSATSARITAYPSLFRSQLGGKRPRKILLAPALALNLTVSTVMRGFKGQRTVGYPGRWPSSQQTPGRKGALPHPQAAWLPFSNYLLQIPTGQMSKLSQSLHQTQGDCSC